MEKTEISQDNFYLGTKCKFKGCKSPKREPDYVSCTRSGMKVSSMYWYGQNKNGAYVIRSSDHWSDSNDPVASIRGKIASCYWWLTTNSKSAYEGPGYDMWFTGKAYFKDFTDNTPC